MLLLPSLPAVRWGRSILHGVIALFGFLPLLPLLFLLLAGDGGNHFLLGLPLWVVVPYLLTTLKMVAVSGFMAVVIGLLLAWLFAFFSFPYKKIFSWLVLLPFTMPPYISALVWLENASPGGALIPLLSLLPSSGGPPNIRHWLVAAILLAVSFYPYVYLLARSFLSSSRGFNAQLEMARVMGLSMADCFWQLFLPLIYPTMVAGFVLVALEVMADYGAMNFFAVKTLSVGMYDLWLNLGQLQYARYFCFVIIGLVALLLVIDRWNQVARRTLGGSVQAGTKLAGHGLGRPRVLAPAMAWLMVALLLLLLFLGFFFPFFSLLWWLVAQLTPFHRFGEQLAAVWAQNGGAIVASFGLGLAAAAIIIVFSFFLAFYERQWNAAWLRLPAIFGYALPGTVLALGILAMVRLAGDYLGMGAPSAHLSSALALLLYAYLARFSATAFGAIGAGYAAISPNLDSAARSLGERSWRIATTPWRLVVRQSLSPAVISSAWLWDRSFLTKIGLGGIVGRVHLPLLRSAVVAGLLLAFIEIIKELPITLVLRPFGIQTLAVNVFTFASDERIKQIALPALLIIMVSMGSIWFMKKYWLKDSD